MAESYKLLNVKELADRLGAKVNTVYGWIHEGKIPYIKLGGLIRFRDDVISKWIQENSFKST